MMPETDKPIPDEQKVSNPSDKTTSLHSTTPLLVRVDEILSLQPVDKHKKNLIFLSLAFLFNFTAYTALQNLQSSLNAEVGVASLSVIYAGVIISSLLSPALIRVLGTKWTMAIGALSYNIYTACNFYPQYYTLVPAGLILGLGAGPLWTAQGTYLTTSAISYANLKNIAPETVINQFNGIFFFFFQGSQITGNLISSLVLNPEDSSSSTHQANLSGCGLHICGGSKANASTGDTNNSPSDKATHDILLGIYLACGLISVLIICLFLQKMRRSRARYLDSTFDSLVATFRLMMNPYLLMLLPLIIYSGVEQAFIFGDFTQAFITCPNGIHMVGFVMITFGVADAVCSFALGRLEKYTGRIILFAAGALAHITIMMILLFVWEPSSDSGDLWNRFIMAAVWGFGDAVWQTQILSILGVIFPERQETAFSNFRLAQAVGFCVYFGLSLASTVCVVHKIIALAVLLLIGMLLYAVVEFKIRSSSTL